MFIKTKYDQFFDHILVEKMHLMKNINKKNMKRSLLYRNIRLHVHLKMAFSTSEPH
jgi:hypothetical protein